MKTEWTIVLWFGNKSDGVVSLPLCSTDSPVACSIHVNMLQRHFESMGVNIKVSSSTAYLGIKRFNRYADIIEAVVNYAIYYDDRNEDRHINKVAVNEFRKYIAGRLENIKNRAKQEENKS